MKPRKGREEYFICRVCGNKGIRKKKGVEFYGKRDCVSKTNSKNCCQKCCTDYSRLSIDRRKKLEKIAIKKEKELFAS